MGVSLPIILASALLEQQQLAPTGYGVALLKMLVALILVCILAYLVLRLLRRQLTRSSAPDGFLRVVDRCTLSARQSLWVVEVAGRFFLIGATDGSIAKLAELDGDLIEENRGSPRRKGRFLEVLKRALGQPGSRGTS